MMGSGNGGVPRPAMVEDGKKAPSALTVYLTRGERERALRVLGRLHRDRSRALLRLIEQAERHG